MTDKKQLTKRERQILFGVARGMQNTAMAFALGISIKTVEKHREHLQEKLGFYGAAPLARYAIAIGLIPVPTLADFANPQTVTAGIGIDEAGDGHPPLIQPGRSYMVTASRAIRPPLTWSEPQPGVRREAPDYEPSTDKAAK